MTSVADRVATGVRLLDCKCPGWDTRVIAPINISSTEGCILGQVFGNYWDGKTELGIREGTPFGFMVDHEGYYPDDLPDAIALQEEWQRVIDSRK